jgi:hypothetical protein
MNQHYCPSIIARLRGFPTILLALAGLALSPGLKLAAQEFISPDNTYDGENYFSNDVEIYGNGYFDTSLTISDELSVGDSLYVNNNLYVQNLYANTLYYNYTAPNNLAIDGNLELFSGFNSGMSESWGLGGSWLHASLDLGDLTYTSTDTPAFNISELNYGGSFYPTVFFTGYDGSTSWVWQENGLNGSLQTQMTLAGNGNLTLQSPGSDNSLLLDPQDGQIFVTNSGGNMTVIDANSNSITLAATTQAIIFTNGTTHSSQSITPSGTSYLIGTAGEGITYGSNANAPGSSAFAMGGNTLASGTGSFAIGNNVTAAYYDSIVLGQWNAPISGSGSGSTSWNATDPLFVIGNGANSSSTSNALVILKDGDTSLNGNLTVNGSAYFNGSAAVFNGTVNLGANVTMTQAQGDILMGQFGN